MKKIFFPILAVLSLAPSARAHQEMPQDAPKILSQAHAVFVAQIVEHKFNEDRCSANHDFILKLIRPIKGFYDAGALPAFSYSLYFPRKAERFWQKDCPHVWFMVPPLAPNMVRGKEILVSAQKDGKGQWSLTGTYDLSRLPEFEPLLFPPLFQNLAPESQEAYRTLSVAPAFTSRGVGVGGVPSKEVKALWTLLKLVNAGEVFKALESDASLAGRLFAYCGLYLSGAASVEEEKKSLSQVESVISHQEGCMEDKKKVSSILDDLNCEAYRP